jgi:hypothetical protein
MTSTTTQKINPEDVYNKLVNIAGENNFGLTMTYFNSLYENNEFWSKRQPYGLSLKTFNSYVDFARYEVPWGLGFDIDVIKACCKRNPKIWQEYEKNLQPLNNHGVNQFNKTGHARACLKLGHSKEYVIPRLKRENPELAEKVINNEISATQAMVEAGLRTKKITVYCKAEDFVLKAINNLEINQIEKLVQDLSIYLNQMKNEG